MKLHIIFQKTYVDFIYYSIEILDKEVKPALSHAVTSSNLTLRQSSFEQS